MNTIETAEAPDRTTQTHRYRRLAGLGLLATLGAMTATTLAAADPATTTALLALHLIAATVMITTLTRHLRAGVTGGLALLGRL